MDQHADHRQQERGGQELGDAEDAHLGVGRLQDGEGLVKVAEVKL